MNFKEITRSVQAYGKVPAFVRKHKLWLYFILPGIIHLVLLSLLIWSSFEVSEWAISGLEAWLGEEDVWWKTSLEWILGIGLRVLLFFGYALIYKNLVLVILSPVLALLSERVEEILTGKSYPFHLGRFLKDVWRGVLMAIRCLVYELLLVALVSLFTWVFAPVLAFIITAYFWGVAMVDYSSERKGLSVKQSLSYIRKHRGLALGNGLVFYLLFLVPFVGWIIAPGAGIIAATLAVLETDQEV